MSASRRRGASRLDPIAAAWGGLVGAIGLMTGSRAELASRLVITCAAFAVGGFLAGVRTIDRRAAHAVASWGVGHALWVVFVLLAAIADGLGGPNPPSLVPHGATDTFIAVAAALAAALTGGWVANSWLRPGRQGRR
ncbi:MAG: hypothetical protein IT200_15295 [Thermoleophilia bacterium]|nr:hypothetical protein [Thermoleophilia bacterium]